MTEDWRLERTFDFGGRPVAWDVFGDGAPVVLIHGTPFSSWVWRTIARELARKHKVYLFDLLGYGRSEMAEGADVSLGVQNGLLAALLDHWGLERPKVVAHDFGGATALRAHLLDGCDYDRLLLIDPVAIRPWGSSFVQHVRHHQDAFTGDDVIHVFVWMLVVGCVSSWFDSENAVRVYRCTFILAKGDLLPGTNGTFHMHLLFFYVFKGNYFHRISIF